MRAKYKYPGGTGMIELGDDATLEAVYKVIQVATAIPHFTLKYGPPAAMRTVDLGQREVPAVSLGLDGQLLTVVPLEPRAKSTEATIPQPSHKGLDSRPAKPPQTDNDFNDTLVAWPEREGVLLLRVMPSDNSCLFTAFGGSLPEQIPAPELRQMMARHISDHPDVYNAAILGCPPGDYQRGIQDPDRWGGGIELSILSTIFDTQICTFDVQGQHLISFGEDKDQRCILVYSGIHYDRVAFSYSDHPYDTAPLPPELDRTLWPTDDFEVIEKTKVLIQKLNAVHYYTNTESLLLRCNEVGCDWIGSGQAAAKTHFLHTGHANAEEISDIDE